MSCIVLLAYTHTHTHNLPSKYMCVVNYVSVGYRTLLQVLKGSHKLGRINHNSVGGQLGADLDRVELVKKV